MRPILYLGDTSLSSAAAYLAGLMSLWKWPFDYVPSNWAVSDADLTERSLFVFSDYPAHRIAEPQQRAVLEAVRQGAGLIMLGGWESFQGSGGGWATAPLAEALPVNMEANDDRVNYDQPILVRRVSGHACVDGLPWNSRPPAIGGYNRLTPKPGAEAVLEAYRFDVRDEGDFDFREDAAAAPLLIVGAYGNGRTAALATDVAPHWVGPLVDWGPERVTAQAPGAEPIEVGSCYAQFFRQLLAWTGRLDDQS